MSSRTKRGGLVKQIARELARNNQFQAKIPDISTFGETLHDKNSKRTFFVFAISSDDLYQVLKDDNKIVPDLRLLNLAYVDMRNGWTVGFIEMNKKWSLTLSQLLTRHSYFTNAWVGKAIDKGSKEYRYGALEWMKKHGEVIMVQRYEPRICEVLGIKPDIIYHERWMIAKDIAPGVPGGILHKKMIHSVIQYMSDEDYVTVLHDLQREYTR